MATQHLTETIEHLDFSEALPCESVNMFQESNCPGKSEAVWSVTTNKNCCPASEDAQPVERVYCDECFQRRANGRVTCCYCFHTFHPGRSIMIRVVPL